MKKILCLIDTLGMGGAERQMIGLAHLLKNKGYDVDLVTYHNHDSNAMLQEYYGLSSTILETGMSRWSKIKAVRNYIKENGKFDYVIAYKDGPCVIGCILKLLGGKFKLIVSERNTNLKVTGYDKLKFFMYRLSDYVVPNSFSQAKFIKDNFPFLSKKVVTITNFTDTDFFVPIDRPENNPIKILTVARIARQKNVLNYLKAIKKLKDLGVKIKFEWYGNVQINDEGYEEEVSAMRERLQIEDMITFYPATKDILSHYQSCDIFCLPSIYEGYPNVVCEAMSCGKPIVCSRVCDNPNIVQEGVNGLLFNPYDVNDMVDQILKMISMSRETLISYGDESHAIALKLFSKNAFVNKYINLIKS